MILWSTSIEIALWVFRFKSKSTRVIEPYSKDPHTTPFINLHQHHPLIYSYEDTLSQSLTIRKKLKLMLHFLTICQEAKDPGLLAVHHMVR